MWSGAGGRNEFIYPKKLDIAPSQANCPRPCRVELKSLLDIALRQVGRFNEPTERGEIARNSILIYFLEKTVSGFDGL